MRKDNLLIAIPARGGSKRLPRKNLADIDGKPMLAYTIDAALKSGLNGNVYVCTEDDEIADVSKEYGAKVFEIPEAMADDLVSSTVPCLALYDYLTSAGDKIEYIFNLQPTSPLRDEIDIANSFDEMVNAGADYLVSVTEIDPHYFHWAVMKKDHGWEMYFGKEFLKERPLLPPVYRPNGAIKIGKSLRLKETGNVFGHPLAVYMMSEEKSIHVATYFDLLCVRALVESRKKE